LTSKLTGGIEYMAHRASNSPVNMDTAQDAPRRLP
jgi:hypothetical protein